MSQVASNPSTTFNILPGQQTVGNAAHKVLFIGQKTSAGTATAGTLNQNILNDSSEDTLYGPNSTLAGMVREYKKLNQVTRIDAISLADNGVTKAVGAVTFTGTATAVGSFTAIIGSKKNHSLILPVAIGDTATIMGDKLDAAVLLDTKIPVTTTNTTGAVAVTAVNAGTVGNAISLKVTGSAAGLSVAVTGMSAGATDPVLTNVFDVVGNERYQTIVAPFQYGPTFLTDFLDPRENVTNIVLDGVGIMTTIDTFSNIETAANAENSKSLVLLGNAKIARSDFDGGALLELDYAQSAQFAANRAKRLTEGANIADIVVGPGGALDSFGGIGIASLPYFNTPFPLLPIIDIGDGFSDLEVESLKTAGASVFGNNITGTSILSDEVVTTRKTDAAGNPEDTFKYLNSVDVSSGVREFYFNNNRAQFAQSRLTNGDLVPNRKNANADSIRNFQVGLYSNPVINGLLVASGEASLQFFKQNITVTVNELAGSATITMKVIIVSQLRTIIGTIEFVFSPNQ